MNDSNFGRYWWDVVMYDALYEGRAVHYPGSRSSRSIFAGEQPALPIAYVDGVILDRYPVAQLRLEIPIEYADHVVIVDSTGILFTDINIALMLITAILIVRTVPACR